MPSLRRNLAFSNAGLLSMPGNVATNTQTNKPNTRDKSDGKRGGLQKATHIYLRL